MLIIQIVPFKGVTAKHMIVVRVGNMGGTIIAVKKDALTKFRREEFVEGIKNLQLKRLLVQSVQLRGVTAKQLIVVLVRRNMVDTIFANMKDVQAEQRREEFAEVMVQQLK